jgi:toxin ParE1/3/4
MRRRRILQTELARTDLIEIWLHIAASSLAKADRLLGVFRKKLQFLARNPLAGRSREELAPGLRSFPLGDYLIFYQPDAEGIVIIRVLSGYRDLASLFDEPS